MVKVHINNNTKHNIKIAKMYIPHRGTFIVILMMSMLLNKNGLYISTVMRFGHKSRDNHSIIYGSVGK